MERAKSLLTKDWNGNQVRKGWILEGSAMEIKAGLHLMQRDGVRVWRWDCDSKGRGYRFDSNRVGEDELDEDET
ncbi:hypothetical protein PVK06_005592 [Gossypium arboreum]|uniref:Uncharacterized protein n=1 Tax=Gossypium arboreum TaxID=29729 RepID=A0ABR0QVF0_GOSAR|nr:hypothetical protein PVK06_005592 [Gossypium arboreum]